MSPTTARTANGVRSRFGEAGYVMGSSWGKSEVAQVEHAPCRREARDEPESQYSATARVRRASAAFEGDGLHGRPPGIQERRTSLPGAGSNPLIEEGDP